MRSFFIPALTAVASLGIPGALASVTCDQGSGSDSKPLLDARELIDTTQECIQNLCATKEEGITTKQCGPLVVSVARLTALPSNAEECMIQLNSIINECISTESTSGGFSGTKDALYDISFPDQEDDERDDPYRGLWTGGHVPDGEPDSDVEDGEDGFEVDLNTVKDSETRRHRIKRQPGKSSPKTKKSGKSSSSKASSTKSKAAPKSTLKTTAKGSGKAAATQGSKKATSSAKITPSSSKKASTSAKPTSKSSKKAQSSAKATSNSSRKSTSSAKATVSSSPSSTSSDNAACTLTNQKDSKNNKGTGKNESSSGKGNTKNGRNLDRRGCGQSHQVEDDIPLEQPRRPVRPYQKKELDPNKVTWWSFNNMRQGTVDPAVQEIINGLGVKAQLDVVKISNAALSVRGRFGPDKTKLKRINPGYWTKRGDKYLVVNGGFYDPVKSRNTYELPVGETVFRTTSSSQPQRLRAIVQIPSAYTNDYARLQGTDGTSLMAGPDITQQIPNLRTTPRFQHQATSRKPPGSLDHAGEENERLAIVSLRDQTKYAVTYTCDNRFEGVDVNQLRANIERFLAFDGVDIEQDVEQILNLDGGGSVYMTWSNGGKTTPISVGQNEDERPTQKEMEESRKVPIALKIS